jgi:hypothetical protein
MDRSSPVGAYASRRRKAAVWALNSRVWRWLRRVVPAYLAERADRWELDVWYDAARHCVGSSRGPKSEEELDDAFRYARSEIDEFYDGKFSRAIIRQANRLRVELPPYPEAQNGVAFYEATDENWDRTEPSGQLVLTRKGIERTRVAIDRELARRRANRSVTVQYVTAVGAVTAAVLAILDACGSGSRS